MSEMLTTRQVAELLGIHYATVGAWRRRDYGPRAIRLGKNWRYPRRRAGRMDRHPPRPGRVNRCPRPLRGSTRTRPRRATPANRTPPSWRAGGRPEYRAGQAWNYPQCTAGLCR
jgi:hypothetical protein